MPMTLAAELERNILGSCYDFDSRSQQERLFAEGSQGSRCLLRNN